MISFLSFSKCVIKLLISHEFNLPPQGNTVQIELQRYEPANKIGEELNYWRTTKDSASQHSLKKQINITPKISFFHDFPKYILRGLTCALCMQFYKAFLHVKKVSVRSLKKCREQLPVHWTPKGAFFSDLCLLLLSGLTHCSIICRYTASRVALSQLGAASRRKIKMAAVSLRGAATTPHAPPPLVGEFAESTWHWQ